MNSRARDKSAERFVRKKIGRTYLRSFRILGSERMDEDTACVYILRTVGTDNYIFKIYAHCTGKGSYETSGFIPVNTTDEWGEYRIYDPRFASEDALRPTESEIKRYRG